VLLRNGFEATGEVCLYGAHIGSNLDCDGGRFTSSSDGYALDVENVDVAGSAYLRSGFEATGGVRLYGAHIRGNLECEGRFTNPDGYALDAESVDVSSNVGLRNWFEATGEVRLIAARVGRQLNCGGGRFSNPDGYALDAALIDVKASVLLRNGFEATGEVRLHGAHIGGSLDCDGGRFTNPNGYTLNAARVVVAGEAVFHSADFGRGTVAVRGAEVGELSDDVNSWPRGWDGDGFTFEDFGGSASTDPRQRIDWLECQGGSFRPGPYTHLADVLRKRGDLEAARKVLIAREQQRSAALYPRWRRALHRVWGALSAFGYRPSRAVWLLLGLIAFGGAAFWFAPMDPVRRSPLPLRPWLYAADLAIPLVDLRQAAHWQPAAGWAQLCMVATIGLGWFFSGAFVAAVTGLFKPDE
jgi:hypothetical protein